MKESLRLLNVHSSSLEELKDQKSDDEISECAQKITDPHEKIKYLKGNVGLNSTGNPKSKHYLASLLKGTDPELACDLTFSVCNSVPSNPTNYILFAEIACENHAWLVAQSAIDVVRWLTGEKDKELLVKAKILENEILNKINSRERDDSVTPLWVNKSVEKYWILERLYFQAKEQKAIDLAFRLLDLFPHDNKSYEVVFKALTLIDNKNTMRRFLQYIKDSKFLDDSSKVIYLGLINYHVGDIDTSMESLKKASESDSTNMKVKYYLALCYLLKQNLKEFINVFNKMLPGSEASYVALYFVYSAVSGFKLDEIEFPDQKNISSEISKIIKKLIDNNQNEAVNILVAQFDRLNFHKILPFLNLYLAELYIKEGNLKVAKELLKKSNDNEVHRLSSWMYRLEGDEELAEKELAEYRRHWIPEKGTGFVCKPVSLNPPEVVPDKLEDILGSIKRLYHRAKEVTAELDMEYGLNMMTCIETGCQDCCKKTFPYVSYVEYLYLKNYLEEQPESFRNEIYKKSVEIVNNYKEKYKKDPPLVVGGKDKANIEYPNDFKFDCPCLGDNKCNAYDGRPFTCRAYGFGSADGTRYKGCSYFFEQFKGVTKLNSIRKVIDMNSFVNYASQIDEKLIGKHVIAPIPVWFAYTHEENLERIKSIH